MKLNIFPGINIITVRKSPINKNRNSFDISMYLDDIADDSDYSLVSLEYPDDYTKIIGYAKPQSILFIEVFSEYVSHLAGNFYKTSELLKLYKYIVETNITVVFILYTDIDDYKFIKPKYKLIIPTTLLYFASTIVEIDIISTYIDCWLLKSPYGVVGKKILLSKYFN